MVIVRRPSFGVSRYAKTRLKDPATIPAYAGLVVPFELRLPQWVESWFSGEAFIDPGADVSLVSINWLAEHTGTVTDGPKVAAWWCLRTPVEVRLVGRQLSMPGTTALRQQGGRAAAPAPWAARMLSKESPRQMAGFEDLLLGRDFLRLHKMTLIVDGDDGGSFALLWPDDPENTTRRDQIRDLVT